MYTTTLSDKSGDFATIVHLSGSHENRFVFPRSFDRSEFGSLESIRDAIRDQAISAGLPELEEMLSYSLYAPTGDPESMTVRCMLCKAEI